MRRRGLDWSGFRYFSEAQARFTSPDKLNVTDDRLLAPSTLNKYAYAANNPFRFKDPDGRDVVALLEPPHGVRPGHFALFAHNPSTNQAAFMSFGPTDQSFSGNQGSRNPSVGSWFCEAALRLGPVGMKPSGRIKTRHWVSHPPLRVVPLARFLPSPPYIYR